MLLSGISMNKLILALVLGLGSHLVAGQPAATAQTLGDHLEYCACAVQPNLWATILSVRPSVHSLSCLLWFRRGQPQQVPG